MRILHIVRQFSPAIGGLENFVYCLAKAQLHTGHQPEVLTLDTVFHRGRPRLSPMEVIDGISVRRISWKGSFRYPFAPSALSHLNDFDIIHVHAVDFFSDYLSLTRLYHQKPLVLSTHGGFFHSGFASRLKNIFFNTVTRLSVKGFGRVIACSQGDAALFEPLCKDWLQTIENGVDIEKFSNQGPLVFDSSFLFIGRFSTNKRIDLLLVTINQIKQHNPNVRLSIVGRDWDDNLAKIRQQITTLDLSKQVTVMLDLDDNEIKAQIARHCFVVSASEYEGFGMTLIEGMSAGLIPIASPINSFKKIINDAGVGHLVDFQAPAAAAQSILTYINGIKERYSSVRNGAIAASSKYGWPDTATRFMHVYENVLGERARMIQGVEIDTKSGQEVISLIDDAIVRKQPVRIAIANAHTINLARGIPTYRALLREFLVLNDGTGVNLASKWKYKKSFCENLNGTDFVPRLLTHSSRSLRIFIVGGHPDVVKKAFQQFSQRYPNHQWVGYQHGFTPFSEENDLCARIRTTSPDLLLVAMGNPLQEEWIARCSDRTGATVCVGVGALFDFVAGQVLRAPKWIRKINCEWVYRLVQEPSRMWRRYLIGNLTFLWAAAGDRL